jgi:hypothetical protein
MNTPNAEQLEKLAQECVKDINYVVRSVINWCPNDFIAPIVKHFHPIITAHAKELAELRAGQTRTCVKCKSTIVPYLEHDYRCVDCNQVFCLPCICEHFKESKENNSVYAISRERDTLRAQLADATEKLSADALYKDLAHRVFARLLETEAKCEPQGDIELRAVSIINERDTLRELVEELWRTISKRDAQLADSQSMVEHLRLELEAHRNGTVAKESEDMAADNARLSSELADSQRDIQDVRELLSVEADEPLCKQVDKELSRWQESIRNLLVKETGCDSIDGKGCDSGDPLDFTLSEVKQGLAILQDKLTDSQKRVRELEGLLDRSYDELKNMRHKLWHGEAPGTEGEQRRSVLMGNIEAARQSQPTKAP